jgi:UDP-GlcNAc3NAcA epimerase
MIVATIVGARPQFVKAAVVSRHLQSRPGMREILVHTGQHFDANMSEVFFRELGLAEPDYNLGISGGTHGEQTGRMLELVERVLLKERPDLVLVYGDTNSTLAGALAAAKLHIPIAHVEAGLRSFNQRMPEEVNRILTDRISALLFAPTEQAERNLLHEGVPASQIRLVGDVMYDAALEFGAKAEAASGIMDELGLRRGEYLLATIHRAENTDDPVRIRAIVEGLGRLSEEIRVVLPLHPRTRNVLGAMGLGLPPGVQLCEPLGYVDMLMLEKHARAIVTDSGGVQKEAYFFRVPCITLRDETEWVELVESGWNLLLPPRNAEQVHRGVREGMDRTGREVDLYGSGEAGASIAQILASCNGAARPE